MVVLLGGCSGDFGRNHVDDRSVGHKGAVGCGWSDLPGHDVNSLCHVSHVPTAVN